MKIKINEAKSIENEYQKDWSDIDRNIFDQIILLDPQTNVENNFIGASAKQLLLPKYLAGETDLLDKAEDIKNALTLYLANRGKVAAQFRNIANFPSVKEFIEFMNDPSNLEGNENSSKEPKEASAKVQETGKDKLEKIRQKDYSNLTEELFFDLVDVDPLSDIDDGKIGNVAKNLLLRLARSNTAMFPKTLIESLPIIISKFYDREPYLSSEAKDLMHYKNIHDFIDIVHKGESSDYIEYLKKCPEWKNIEYLGSTNMYDVVSPLTCNANAWIAGADSKVGGPGFSSGHSAAWNANAYGHWCTSEPSFWRSHTGGPEERRLFCFIVRGTQNGQPRRVLKERLDNYQIEITKDGRVVAAADGYEHYQGLGWYDDLLRKDPELYTLLGSYGNTYFGNNEKIKNGVAKLATYSKYEYRGGQIAKEDLVGIQNYCKILTVIDGVTKIPAVCFANCNSITTIRFPNTLTEIGTQAFKNCFALSHLTLPSNLQAIRAEAFANCISLKGTTRLPNTLEYIGKNAFEGTNVTLSILKDRPEGSLYIDVDTTAEDPYAWYNRHAKLVNEDLEPINENIPRVLVDAGIKELNARQAGTRIDFGKAQFDEKSKEYVCDYLGVTYDNTTDSLIRTKPKEDVLKNLTEFIFVYDSNRFAFWGYDEQARRVDRLHMTNIPEEAWNRVLQEYPALNDKYAGGFRMSNGNRSFATGYAFIPTDFWMCIQTASKIYQTDLSDYIYDPAGVSTHLTRKPSNKETYYKAVSPGYESDFYYEKNLEGSSLDYTRPDSDKDLTSKKNIDTYQKISNSSAYKAIKHRRPEKDDFDQGMIYWSDTAKQFTASASLLEQLAKTEKAAYAKYDALRLYSKNHKKDFKLVDRLFLEQKVDEALKAYEQARDNLIKGKKTFIKDFDYALLAYENEYAERKKRFQAKTEEWRKRIVDMRTEQKQLEGQIAEARKWTVEKSPAFKQILGTTDAIQNRLNSIDATIASQSDKLAQLEASRQNWEKQIEEYQARIAELMQKIDTIPERAKEIEEETENLNNTRQQVLVDLETSGQAIEANLEQLASEHDDEVAKLSKSYEQLCAALRDEGVYMFSDRKQKEADPELLKKFMTEKPDSYKSKPIDTATTSSYGNLYDDVINSLFS